MDGYDCVDVTSQCLERRVPASPDDRSNLDNRAVTFSFSEISPIHLVNIYANISPFTIPFSNIPHDGIRT